MEEEIPGQLSPYARRPPYALLPGLPARPPFSHRLGRFFAVRFLTALPDDLADAAAALLDPLERAARLAGRLLHGPALRGGWHSEAGGLALALYGFHWTRWQAREHGPGATFRVEPGRLTAHPPWGRSDPSRAARTTAAALRRIPRPRRRRTRVDLAFPDGSWLSLRMNTARDAARLRRSLAAPGS
ncbi:MULTISPECIES: hypothetical protein [unclassified Streptomyces]|uniref:hypothetical protein n=1 Tax=unclassified Streptomyces TaxID=2593676 RepID=UPI000DC77FA6|nr:MULTISPECIES: hypothetical protein [unclassified Streptomyces]AWZ09567.1 hypothetical protein DRB89_39775 [Streptomyces sp. ICC4]AWZ17291.1 hypothetical protein DRB96_39975 [Streptomyces sp. ICC1]